MGHVKLCQLFIVLFRFFFFLVAQILVSLFVCMHLLLVLLFSVFHFNLMGLDHSLDLIFIHFLHILLGFYEELVSSSVFLFFVLDFLFHSFYFILFLFKLLLGFMVRGHLHVFDLGFQIFNICLVPVSLGFLDQDLI